MGQARLSLFFCFMPVAQNTTVNFGPPTPTPPQFTKVDLLTGFLEIIGKEPHRKPKLNKSALP